MCHADSDLPELGPGITTSTGASIILTAADGAKSRGYLAVPAKASGAGVIVMPDNRGIHPFYEQLACRIAAEGHYALAIDYFGRTAGTGPRDDSFSAKDHFPKASRETVEADLTAAIAHMRSVAGPELKSIFTVGFCFGGRQSFLSASRKFGLAGVVGFYGVLATFPNGAPGPAAVAGDFTAPTLGLFGSADQATSAADIVTFDEALTSANVEHELVTYPGAPHSFFDKHLTEYLGFAQDAWAKTIAFIDNNAAA
jgi:carboxymethylenebutenolidase